MTHNQNQVTVNTHYQHPKIITITLQHQKQFAHRSEMKTHLRNKITQSLKNQDHSCRKGNNTPRKNCRIHSTKTSLN